MHDFIFVFTFLAGLDLSPLRVVGGSSDKLL
jgi:hypothetical protein